MCLSGLAPNFAERKRKQLIDLELRRSFGIPRGPRKWPAGTYFHVLNRVVGRGILFVKSEDDEVFERVVKLAVARVPLPIYSYILTPNHWHFVVRPEMDAR